MDSKNISQEIKQKASAWLTGKFDEATRREVQDMLDNRPDELTECFYKDLEFGTGGLRGIMGVGTNRMNVYTVGMATQGLCNYLKKNFAGLPEIKVAVGHDSRNNSRLFAETTAGIFAANGIRVYLFDALRPTPELSFAIRHLGCQSGVVVTASHNPKEYNGYKAYWDDGAQVIPPHDKNIIAEVGRVTVDQVKFNGPQELITIIGSELDEVYTDRIKALSLSPEAIARHKDLKIVYTPIHGTGVKLVPMALKKLGFENIIHIPEQDISDGNFPTVVSPNPEEPAALSLAVAKAEACDADVVFGTDPDADRIGLAVKDDRGKWILLSGNQSATLLIYYLVRRWKETGRLKGHEYLVKTIVTTELIRAIAQSENIPCYDVLTGFKWIADTIARHEATDRFIGGGEESYGYLCGEFVRDKDAVMSGAMFAELTAWAKDQGKTLYDILMDIYVRFGVYKAKGISVVKKGKSGAEEIERMMSGYRAKPFESIAGHRVVQRTDYLLSQSTDCLTGATSTVNLPKSNVLQYVTEDGAKVTIRPSGTEPKIKFYIEVHADLPGRADFSRIDKQLSDEIDRIAASF
ncbi:MAG: phospho-sugar mutase [Bacteroidales bacterium]|nr:phospho-sugar mutase [Bacteroidales bacterium]